MSDIPLNLEDGAFWLPYDVLQEITTTNTNSKKMTTSSISYHTTAARENVKVSAFSKGNGFNLASQLIPPFTPFPAVPQNLGFENMIMTEMPKGPAWPFLVNGEMGPGFTVKSEGTGVYLPRSAATSSSLKIKKTVACEEIGGTGVFLHRQAMIASHKKKKGRKNDRAWKKQEKVEHAPNELRLPEEWTY